MEAKQGVWGRPLQRDVRIETRKKGTLQRPGGGAPDRGQQVQGSWGGSVPDMAKEPRGTSVTGAEGSRGRGQGKRGLVGQSGDFSLYSVSWEPLEVWGIGEMWSDLYQDPSGCCVENRLGMRTGWWSGNCSR